MAKRDDRGMLRWKCWGRGDGSGGGDGGLIVATITTTDIGVKARGVETTKRLVVVVMVWLGCECHRRRPMAVPSKWRINVLSSVEQV